MPIWVLWIFREVGIFFRVLIIILGVFIGFGGNSRVFAQSDLDVREVPSEIDMGPESMPEASPSAQSPAPSDKDFSPQLSAELERMKKNLQKVVPDNRGVISLSFEQALQMAIINNLRTLTAVEKLQEANGDFRQSLSGLLPQISGKVTQTRRTSNFLAEGIDPSALPAGFPTGVFGPYNNFDARISLMQNIFDLTAIGDFQAGQSLVRQSKLNVILAREKVTHTAGLTYVKVLKAQADVKAAEADLELAKTLYELTLAAFQSGVVTGVDLTRAEVKVVQNETRLIQAKTAETTNILQLKEILLLPMGAPLKLTSTLEETAPQPPSPEAAIAEANANRPDLKVVKEEIRMRGYEYRAAVGQQVPSIGFGINYGGSGNTPTQGTAGTYQMGGVLNIPVFDGGLTLGKMKSSKSKQRQAKLVLGQLNQQVNSEVRMALEQMNFARQQIVAAKKNLSLSEQELELSRDRFFTGVGDNLELVQAQTNLAQARDSYVTALADFNTARIQLATALGKMEDFNL